MARICDISRGVATGGDQGGACPRACPRACPPSSLPWCNDGPSEKGLYRTCRKLSSLIENYVMEGVSHLVQKYRITI